jgi:tripartite-type tricarboxylate transporter receptor subunit TctC
MKLPRRTFLHLAAGAAALPAVSRIAWARTYPARPVRLLFGFAAGGPGDTVVRLMGQWLSERLGQQFVVENRLGAGGNIATEAVVRSPPDGYTLLVVNASNAINATVYEKLSFNFIRDIAPVAGIMRQFNILVVHPSVPVATVPEFIAYAKANPGKLSQAVGGVGTPGHVAGEQFKLMTASTWCRCHIAAEARRSQICSPGRCRSISVLRALRWTTSGPASCGR